MTESAKGPGPRVVRAAWVCPLDRPPLSNGWVVVEDGRITAVGHGDAPRVVEAIDLGSAVVLPGLVNAHTHLELSWLRGRVPPAADFLTWVGVLMRQRSRLEAADDPGVMTPLAEALVEMRAAGTIAVGDVSNSLVSPPLLATAGVPSVVFHELIGFRAVDGDALVEAGEARRRAATTTGVRVVPAAHAPFSVSRELFVAVRDRARRDHAGLTSIHVGESAEEVQLLQHGDGPWRQRLHELGAWRDDWEAPGVGPGDYLCSLGVLAEGALAVHGVQLTDLELERLAAAGVTLVTCPRSNRWVGVGSPPLERFVASGVRLAIGTDSLASAPDLNLFGELAEMRRIAPGLSARQMLRAATAGGAEALGLAPSVGSLAPGSLARLIAVDVREGLVDPEEHLVSGVPAASIRHVTFTSPRVH